MGLASATVFSMSCGQSANEKHDNEQAVRLELGSLVSLLDKDLESAKRKFRVDVEGAAARSDVDELVRMMKADLGELVSACDSSSAKLDTLEAYLLRNQAHAEALKFSDVRATIASKRSTATNIKTEAASSLSGFRSVKMNVKSREEWQSLGVAVRRGDIVLVSPQGKWEIGGFAGACAASGMQNQSIQPYALDPAHPVGCLLVRSGKATLGAGELLAKIEGQEGDLEARCNDREYLNNSGVLAVHVVAFSPVPSAFKNQAASTQ